MKINSEMSKEELLEYTDNLTVGKLKEFLNKHKLPDNAIVIVQRIEDVYYEKHGWSVYLKSGEYTNKIKKWNKDVMAGKYSDEEEYPKLKGVDLKLYTESDIHASKEQYHPVWCCVRYKDDKDVLFLDLHF